MASGAEVASPKATSSESFLEKVGPHAPKIMLGAAIAGLIAVFLPAVTVSFMGVSESVAVIRDWRGKLCLVGYIGVGVMAGLMLKKQLADVKNQILACLITAGVAALLSVWLLLAVSDTGYGGMVETGFGCYVNILAALVLAGGAAIQAKRANVF